MMENGSASTAADTVFNTNVNECLWSGDFLLKTTNKKEANYVGWDAAGLFKKARRRRSEVGILSSDISDISMGPW